MGKRRMPADGRRGDEDEDDREAEQEREHVGVGVGIGAISAENRAERRRRQCRISQRRYRDKKGSMEYNLRLDINELRESVDRLKQARLVLETKMHNDRQVLKQSVLKAVEQYYVMFKCGLHDPDAGKHVRQCYDIQVRFLRAFMHPDVQMGDQRGIDVVLEQWRRYSRYHSALRCKLVSAQVFGADTNSPIVKATGRLVVTLNRTTLEEIFPTILQNEAVAEFLIGREVEYTTCTEYMFNRRVQVVRQDLTVDFFSGFGAVLRDPFVTSDLLKAANITHDSFLGPLLPTPTADTDTNTSTSFVGARRPVHHHATDAGSDSPSGTNSSRLDLQFIMS